MRILKAGFILEVLREMVQKMRATLDLCRSVVESRSPYEITQKWVDVSYIG